MADPKSLARAMVLSPDDRRRMTADVATGRGPLLASTAPMFSPQWPVDKTPARPTGMDILGGYARGGVKAAKDFNTWMKNATVEDRQAAVKAMATSMWNGAKEYGGELADVSRHHSPLAAAGKVVVDAFNPVPALKAAGETLHNAVQLGDDTAWRNAFLGGVGAAAILPFNPLGAGEKAVAKGLIKGAEEGASKDVARTLVTGAKPTRGIINTPDLRQMTQDEAIATARQEPHLIQAKDGQYAGLPRGVTTPEQIGTMRQNFDADVALGARGAQWYPLERDFNVSIAGANPARQRLLAGEQGLWSAQANPDTNFNFLLQGHNAYEAGVPLDKVRTGAQARTYNEARPMMDEAAAAWDPMLGHNGGPPLEDGLPQIPLGKKTGVYAQHLDPTVPHATTGTNDIWHARGFGYTNADGSTFSRALTAQEHRALDYETMLAVDRANEAGLEGRYNWQAHEIQAAPWVAGKGRKLAESKFGTTDLTPEQLRWGIDEASKSYKDYADKYTAFATHEPIPFVDSGHLPSVSRGSQEARDAYAMDPRTGWVGPDGRDIIYDAQGLYARPTLDAQGIYTPPGGGLETNPAQVARPLVGMVPSEFGPTVDPASRAIMNVSEAFRGYVDAQGAGAWHKPTLNSPAGQSGSVWIPHEGKLSRDEALGLKALGGAHGLGDVVDTGQGVTMSNFWPGPPQGAETRKALSGDLGAGIEGILPGAEPQRARVTQPQIGDGGNSGYLGYEDQWRAPGGPTQGHVTQQMLDYIDANAPFAPNAIDRLDDPAIQQRIAEKMQLANEMAARGEPVNPGVMNALNILSTKGVQGLREALARREVLPAVAAFILGGAALEGVQAPPQN